MLANGSSSADIPYIELKTDLVMLCAVSGIVANNKIAPRLVMIVNNPSFRMRVPMCVRGQKLGVGTWATSDGRPVQQVGDDAVFIDELNAATSKLSSRFVTAQA